MNVLSRTKPHVLQIVGNAIVGGMESHVKTLVGHLRASGYRVSCLCPFESAFTAQLRALGCKVVVTSMPDDPTWRGVEAALAMIQDGVDLLHAHLMNAQTLAGVVSSISRVPSVVTIHGRDMTGQEISVARTCGMQVVVVCQEAYARAVNAGVPPEHLSLINNGIDTKLFSPRAASGGLHHALNLPPGTALVGYVGRLSWEKGPDTFVKVAAEILRTHTDTHFVLIGEGAMKKDLIAHVQRDNIASHVHFLDPVDCPETIYPDLSMLVQTSRSEGLSLVALEAMSCGLPIVAVAVGGLLELIESGRSGILIREKGWAGNLSAYAGDASGIAAAVSDLLKDAHLRQCMGEAARERVRQHFDLVRMVREVTDLYEQMGKGSNNADREAAPLSALPH